MIQGIPAFRDFTIRNPHYFRDSVSGPNFTNSVPLHDFEKNKNSDSFF